MKQIILTDYNTTIIVDDDIFLLLINKNIFINGSGYAQFNEGGKTVMVHRFVIGACDGDQVDHINEDKLDDRKINLQIVSSSLNNSKRSSFNAPAATGYKNVGFANRKKFIARLRVGNKILNGVVRSTAFQAAVDAQNLFEIHKPFIDSEIFYEGWVGI